MNFDEYNYSPRQIVERGKKIKSFYYGDKQVAEKFHWEYMRKKGRSGKISLKMR